MIIKRMFEKIRVDICTRRNKIVPLHRNLCWRLSQNSSY